jgi:uncharacterized protein (TIGR02301 family)
VLKVSWWIVAGLEQDLKGAAVIARAHARVERSGRRIGGAGAAVALACAVILQAVLPLPLAGGAGGAWAAPADGKPYDDKLMRLAEILGAVHYLRELCSAHDGQLWRDRMKELLDTEGGTALRKARLTRSFNQGYRSYRRTYVTCTPTAQSSIERFLAEGVQLGDGLVKSVP